MSLPPVFTLVLQSPARPAFPHNSAHRAFAYCVFSFALHQMSNAKQRPVNPMYYNVFAKISETLRPASTPAASTTSSFLFAARRLLAALSACVRRVSD
jgi:hypothetical protein